MNIDLFLKQNILLCDPAVTEIKSHLVIVFRVGMIYPLEIWVLLVKIKHVQLCKPNVCTIALPICLLLLNVQMRQLKVEVCSYASN